MQFLYPDLKVMNRSDLLEFRARMRHEGRRVVLTNGCFDILHRGHVDYLFKARAAGDALIVLINSDRSVRQLKGDGRPVNMETDRAFVLAGLACVDAVFIFDAERCTQEILDVSPDIYAKGADYCFETLNSEERDALIHTGAEAVFIPFVAGCSTTQTIQKMNTHSDR